MLSYQTPFDAFFSPVRYQPQRQNMYRTRQASQPTFEDLLLNLFDDECVYDYDYNDLSSARSTSRSRNIKKSRTSKQPITRTFTPEIDAYDNQSSYLIKVNLQGATINDIDLQYDSKLRNLTISSPISRLRTFEKTIKFPENVNINENKITARFNNEMLSVTVPKESIYDNRKRCISTESDFGRYEEDDTSDIDCSNDSDDCSESETDENVGSENDEYESDSTDQDLFQDDPTITEKGHIDLEKSSTNSESKKLIIQPSLEEVKDEDFSDLSSNF